MGKLFLFIFFGLIFWLLSGSIFLPENVLETLNLENEFLAPSFKHLFGFGENGIDLYWAVTSGMRNSLLISVLGVFGALCLGCVMGILSGWKGGKLDFGLMRLIEVLEAFPGILIYVALAVSLGPSQKNVVFIVWMTFWIGFFRQIRNRILIMKNLNFVHAAQAIGADDFRILRTHIFPHLTDVILIQSSLSLSQVILVESSLGFLGLGGPPGTVSLGSLVYQGRDVMTSAPHALVIPGLCLAICVAGFHYLSDFLTEYFQHRTLRGSA